MASMAKSVVLVPGYAVHWRLFGMSIDALLIQRIINPHSNLGLFCHKFPKWASKGPVDGGDIWKPFVDRPVNDMMFMNKQWYCVLLQKRRNSIANALELRLFCIKPSICPGTDWVIARYCLNPLVV